MTSYANRVSRDRRLFLRRLLTLQGTLMALVSMTWIFTSTSGRLAGIKWLDGLLSWLPGETDWKLGLGWLIMSLLMLAGGFFGHKVKALEDWGFGAAIFWPIFMGFLFLIAFASGENPSGYVTTISYAAFAGPFLALATLPAPQGAHPETGALPALASEAGERLARGEELND